MSFSQQDLTKLKSKNTELKKAWLGISLVLSIPILILSLLSILSFALTYLSTAGTSAFNNFRYWLLNLYCLITKFPFDGLRNVTKTVDIDAILKCFKQGKHTAKVFDPRTKAIIDINLFLLDDGIINGFTYFDKLNKHHIVEIDEFKVKDFLKT